MIARSLCILSLCLLLVACPGERDLGASGEGEPAAGEVPAPDPSDRSELRWTPEPGTIEGYEQKYTGRTHEEMQLAFDALQDVLTLEKKVELERLHDEGRVVEADRDPSGKPIWPASIPRDCFFQSRTRQIKGRPASEMKAWFVYLPFEEFPHLYEMREELRWLKQTLYPNGRREPSQDGG